MCKLYAIVCRYIFKQVCRFWTPIMQGMERLIKVPACTSVCFVVRVSYFLLYVLVCMCEKILSKKKIPGRLFRVTNRILGKICRDLGLDECFQEWHLSYCENFQFYHDGCVHWMSQRFSPISLQRIPHYLRKLFKRVWYQFHWLLIKDEDRDRLCFFLSGISQIQC